MSITLTKTSRQKKACLRNTGKLAGPYDQEISFAASWMSDKAYQQHHVGTGRSIANGNHRNRARKGTEREKEQSDARRRTCSE